MGFDVEAFLREHGGTLVIAAVAIAACWAAFARMHERARALVETGAALARARASLEERRARGFDVALLARFESLEARLRRLRR